ncbi:ABC transporter permease [Castellaniella sp. GW247-6E4]|uniref:ABC transporter permease n=1 Tax=Castellaniella sp. GW247-6E4 TaxID=3140380 RepID=UPI003314D1AE
MEAQTVVQLFISGVTIGCIYSLVALGFAITLRATELFNFAHGEMVMLGALLGYTLVTTLGVQFLYAFLSATLVLALTGILIERTILRPMLRRKSPLLNLLIATLGISVMLQATAIILWGREPLKYALDLGDPVSLFGVRVEPINLWIIFLSFLLMVALQWFLRRTRMGIAWRAASLDPNTAQLYGMNRNVNVALTFGISAGLGGAAGVLIAPLYYASFGLGQAVLIKSFAAAAIGGFGIIGTVAGGLIIGLLETFGAGLISSEYKNVILYGLLLVILMIFFAPKGLQGRGISESPRILTRLELRLFTQVVSGWVRPAALVAIAALWVLSVVGLDVYALRIMNIACLFAIAALGLQVIVGYTGIFSFGQGALFGVGAYAYAIVSNAWGTPFVLTVALAVLVTLLVAVLILPIFRLRGHYVAVGTLVIGEIIVILISNWKQLTNGAYGIFGIQPPSFGGFVLDTDQSFYVLVSIALFLTWFSLARIMKSRWGRAMRAVRENELAATSYGISPAKVKTIAFLIGAACAGLAGALYASYVSYINPHYFGFEASVQLVVMVVIGGLGSLGGAIIGAAFVGLLPEFLRFLAEYRLVIYGGLIIGFMVALPGGLADVWRGAVRRIIHRRLSVDGARAGEDR